MTSEVTPQIQPVTPLTTEEQNKIVLPSDPWDDRRALNTVKRDFQNAETWRIQNYDRSLRRNDDVYYAVTKVKTWEGTRIPRASIPIWMGMRHVQAIHSHVMQALFADDYPFEALPEYGTTMQQARSVRDLLSSYCQDLNPDVLGMTVREVFSRSWYSALVYGCGPIELNWMMKQMTRNAWTRRAIPERVPMRHPVTGEMVMVSSGQLRWHVDRQSKTYQISRPKAQNHLVYDFYWDPNAPSSNPQEAGMLFTRQLLPVWYLKEICLPEFGFKLPASDEEWRNLQTKYKQTMAEVSASWGELNRGNYWNRGVEQTTDAASQRVEVVRGFYKNRMVWLIGRDFLAFNDTNELGILPFVNNYYIPAPGRPYSISVCDVLEGDQKITQSLLEARLDETSLAIHSPIVRKLGVKIAASQRRIAPGREWEVPDDVNNDIKKMEWPNITQSAYIETQAADARAQQTTGANDISAMGTGTAGGNSANRTATGVSTQNAAFSSRIQALVENCEDQAFEPFLRILFLMAQKYGDPNEPIVAGLSTVDPLDVINATVRFKVKASDKLRIKRATAGGGMDAFLQIAPALQGALTQTGQTLNFDLIGNLIADTFGVPSNEFVTPMSPQQQQMMQQQNMAQINAKMQMQNDRLGVMQQMAESKDETKLIADMVKKLLTPEVIAVIARENGAPEVLKLLEMANAPKQLTGGTS